MTSTAPVNPTVQPPPLVVEQVPPDITIPAFDRHTKSRSSFSLLFNILFFLFGIGGIGYGVYVQQTFVHPLLKSTLKSTLQISTTPQLSLTVAPVSIAPTISSSSSAQMMTKDTLCFTLTLPKKNDIGAENNCDISYRSFPDSNNPDTSVSIGITLNNKEYKSSQDMADQWIQLEQDHGSEDTVVEKGSIQVGLVEGYKVITEYPNKAVQTTHIFIHNPGKYEAYGYPITGFELITASDINTRPIQQKELTRLLETWKWK